MIKKEVSPQDLVPNMILAETILNDYGSVIIMENTVLDEHLIKKLQNQNLLKVKIFEEKTKRSATKIKEVFQKNYNEGIYEVKEIISELIIDKDVKTEKVEKVVDSVINMAGEKNGFN